ncbi:MAG: hypothetical protein JWN38_1109 [Candidatus Saccharibacteria bacterium]|nr:hypothetical protein [Candidatus Saccharibacteria bacterium]
MSPEIKGGPVNPAEARELHNQLPPDDPTEHIPEEVFVVFNGLIARNLYRGTATVFEEVVADALKEQGIDPVQALGDISLLYLEDSYSAAGWKVKYARPVLFAGDDFEPYFEFRAKRKRPK